MVGRGLVSLLGAAIVLGIGAPAALSDEGQRLIMVEHSPFMIEQLEKRATTSASSARSTKRPSSPTRLKRRSFAPPGYKIGQTIENDATRHARKAEIAATTRSEKLASRVRA